MSEIPEQQTGVETTGALASHDLEPGSQLSDQLRRAVLTTQRWVGFFTILGVLAGGVVILNGLAILLEFVTRVPEDPFDLIGFAFFVMLMSGLFLVPARLLARHAEAIGRIVEAPADPRPLETRIRRRKLLWQSAGITTVIFLAFCIAIIVPKLITATNRAKQKRTMADMRVIMYALEARAEEGHSYPPTMDMSSLAAVLEPKYLEPGERMPRRDAWEKAFRYEAVCPEENRCTRYVLMSAARDGEFEFSLADLPEQRYGTTFDQDIALSNGEFVLWPEGVAAQ